MIPSQFVFSASHPRRGVSAFVDNRHEATETPAMPAPGYGVHPARPGEALPGRLLPDAPACLRLAGFGARWPSKRSAKAKPVGFCFEWGLGLCRRPELAAQRRAIPGGEALAARGRPSTKGAPFPC